MTRANRNSAREMRPLALVALACLLLAMQSPQARAGCPFDDGSCQEYCNQQGCNLGYCGHFAWIQCICRKCGDEWNWYDKVHYNPDKQVNQTELDSLKLNASAPLILTTNSNANRQQQQPQPAAALPPPGGRSQAQLLGKPASRAALIQLLQQHQHQKQQPLPAQRHEEPKVAATLTTLLIPDLSDGSKLDLNDIPDENSEKFLDYLTKNHEKLVQATNEKAQRRPGPPAEGAADDETESDLDADAAQQQSHSSSATTPATGDVADETVEIQISSSNNQAPSSSVKTPARLTISDNEDDDGDNQQPQVQVHAQTQSGPVTRLLRMAVAERSPDDIF